MCYQPIIFEQWYDNLGQFHSHYFSDFIPEIHTPDYLRRLSIATKRVGKLKHKYVTVPCGKCNQCRARQARDWKVRLYHHSITEGDSIFVTLTYNDDNMDNHSLDYRHFQLFMKRLRRKFSDHRLSFFCAGEYGSKTLRRHFHCIIFGIDLNEVKSKFLCTSRKDKSVKIWTSDIISNCWNNRGFVSVSRICKGDFRAFGYVSGYIISKSDEKHKKLIERYGLEPEFHHMSLKPCIGRIYYNRNHKQFFRQGFCHFSGRIVSVPRAYDRWYEKETTRYIVRPSYTSSFDPFKRLGMSIHDFLLSINDLLSPQDMMRIIFQYDDKLPFTIDKVSDFDKIKMRRRKFFLSSTGSDYNLQSQKINISSFLGCYDRDIQKEEYFYE